MGPVAEMVREERRSVTEVLPRCLGLRCPACGLSTIVERPFQIKHHCSSCGALFKREDGFFVGAIMANVVTTEAAILVLYLALLPVPGFDDRWLLPTLFAVALLFPVAFYHHSWSIWLSLDHLVESLPRGPRP